MCPVKTANLSVNVSHEEADFWRRLAFRINAKSRGDFQKLLLLVGLERVAPSEAAELKAIRQRVGALALVVVFCVGLVFGDDDPARARGRRCRRAREDAVEVCPWEAA